MGVKRKDVVLKAVSGNVLAARPGAFAIQGFSWWAATFLQPQHCSGMGWAAPGSVFVVAHGAPGPFSPLPQERERVCTFSWHLLFTDSTLGHSLKLHCACRDLSPPQNTSRILVKVADRETAKHFFYFQGWLVHRHPIANCRNHCHWFQWEHDRGFNEVSSKDMDLTSEAIPDMLIICSWRNPGLLSQPAIYQTQQLILEFSLLFY